VASRGTTFANSSCSDGQSPSCQRSRSSFYYELPNIYAIAFLGDRRIAELAVRGKKSSKLPQWKEKLNFYVGIL
jgi:hypothetical protein